MKGAELEWRDFASCVGQDSDLFFNPSREEEAIQFCQACPVKGFCERDGRNYRSVGVWGGTSMYGRENEEPVNPINIQWWYTT